MGTTDKRELGKGFNSSSGAYELVLSPILFALLGHWLDGRFGSGPWLMVIGAVFGLVGASVKRYYTYRFRMDQHAAEARDSRAAKVAA